MAYTLIKQLNPQHAHIQFNGSFQQKMIIWDTHLLTLEEYVKQSKGENTSLKQFIEIEAPLSKTVKLTVVLNLTKINTPTIHKTIIMIKQYKKLRVGRHEFGKSS